MTHDGLNGFGQFSLSIFVVANTLQLLANDLIDPFVLAFGKLLDALQGGFFCQCFRRLAAYTCCQAANGQYLEFAFGRVGFQCFCLQLSLVILPACLVGLFLRSFLARGNGSRGCFAISKQFLDECGHGVIL